MSDFSNINFEVKPKDYSNYLFRPSSLDRILTGFVSDWLSPAMTEKQETEYIRLSNKDKITEKQKEILEAYQAKIDKKKEAKIELTRASKNYLQELFESVCLGISPFTGTNATERGDREEEASIDLVKLAYGIDNLVKNTKTFTNQYLSGTPDLIVNKDNKKIVLDVKTAETYKSFTAFDEDKASQYKYQLWGYKELVGADEVWIVRTLPSYPDKVIIKEINKKLSYLDTDTTTQEQIDDIRKTTYLNMNYDRIDPIRRIKLFKVEPPQISSYIIYQYLALHRLYLNGIVKNYFNLS